MAVEVSLHPLVLLNISDNLTRALAMAASAQTRVIGALVGTVSGRTLQLKNSFEVPFTQEPSGLLPDKEFIALKMDLTKQIFPEFEVLGWYSTGALSERDMSPHNVFRSFNENAVYLVLNTDAPPSSTEKLPVDVYESLLTLHENTAVYQFRSVDYVIETSDAERLSVDYVSRTGTGTNDTSEYVDSLDSFSSAISLFKRRLEKLLALVETHDSVKNDHKLMRRLSEICNLLPVMPDALLANEFTKEIGEELVSVYMSALTKSMDNLVRLGDKIDLITGRN